MMLKDINISVKKSIGIRDDNQTRIKMEHNNVESARNKHIDSRPHVIRYYNDKDIILLEYVESSEMIL